MHFSLRILSTLLLSTVLLGACKKDDSLAGSDGTGNSPRTPVPQELTGTWFAGTIGLINFYNPATGQWSNGRGLGEFYKFNADGTFEYGWQANFNNYGCTTTGMRYLKGTVVVEGSKLTLYDTYGRARGEYSCAPSSNFDRPEQLRVYSIFTQTGTDELGRPVLQLRTGDNGFVSYRRLE